MGWGWEWYPTVDIKIDKPFSVCDQGCLVAQQERLKSTGGPRKALQVQSP